MDEVAAKGIAMRHEEVTVEVHDTFAIVDATFSMANPGAARTLEVGFPGKGVSVANAGYAVHRPLVGFQAWVDGQGVEAREKEIRHEYQHGPPKYRRTRVHRESWHVFQAAFAAKKETRLRVRYGVIAEPYTGSSWSTGETFPDASVWYILATGRRWSGAIGEAVVKILPKGGVKPQSLRITDGRMDPPDRHAELAPVMPDYGKREGDGVTLRRLKLEPSAQDNLRIVYRPDPARWPDTFGAWRESVEEDANRKLRQALGLKDEAAPKNEAAP
jgi:hypothetical protein